MYPAMRTLRFLAALLPGVLLLVDLSGQTAGSVGALLEQIDELYFREEHSAALELIDSRTSSRNPLDSVSGAALAWRSARSRLNRVDLELFAGLGEDAAGRELALAVDSARRAAEFYRRRENAPPYEYARALFWLAAAEGRSGQLQGVLNSLFMADDLRDLLEESIGLDPDFSNPYYVLGQLYDQLPGAPISFGNADRAVNLGRRAVALHEAARARGEVPAVFHDYYLELARHLWNRGWSRNRRESVRRRQRSDYDSAAGALERSYYISAASELPALSDREEAETLLREAMRQLELSDTPERRREKDLAKARGLLEEWGLDQPPAR